MTNHLLICVMRQEGTKNKNMALSICSLYFLLLSAILASVLVQGEAALRRYQFDVVFQNITRLCHSKPTVTVNGKLPGPTIYARDGDRVIVKVINLVPYNVSIHWHGLRQFRNGWMDGPAYITQCPIQSGKSYTYDFNTTGQRGTLWWHAHIRWLRATVHGAIVILPKEGVPYPFPKPDEEKEIVLGEWWHGDVEAVEEEARVHGTPQNLSDAHTINGKAGLLFPCEEKNVHELEVEQNKTYLIRVVNAAMVNELFFAVGGHNLTVVEVDAVYCKPFVSSVLVVAPGQTSNVLLHANQEAGRYFITVKPFKDSLVPTDYTTATAVLQYVGVKDYFKRRKKGVQDYVPPLMPPMPGLKETSFVDAFHDKLRSLNSPEYPANVPLHVDRHILFTMSMGLNPCPECVGGVRYAASFNNFTFVLPETALLKAHYDGTKGVFTPDLPDEPLEKFNYTGAPATANLASATATKLGRLDFNSSVELVLQDTSLLAADSHPFHLHGHNFFVVGRGTGNFDPVNDPKKYNLDDPLERSTVAVPTGGWAAIRFRANNPGVWFMHCHMEMHSSWGLEAAFIVENGDGPEESILPPPAYMPPC